MYILSIPKNKVSSAQALLLKWFKTSGSVLESDVICHVRSGNDILELSSGVSGELTKVLVQEGAVFEVAESLAEIDLPRDGAGQGSEEKNGPEEITSPDQEEATELEVVPIVMPQAGQSMEEGTIVSWKVAVGDRISQGQVIFEIETDKAVMEVEAVNSGRVAKITAKEGDIVEVKQPVAYLAEEGVDVDAWISSQGESEDVKPSEDESSSTVKEFEKEKEQTPVSNEGRVKVSPAARKLAGEKGVDLSKVGGGSGPGGRILSSDIANAEAGSAETRAVPISKMRRAIAKNLQYSKQNVPHFYVKATVDAQKLFDLYRETKANKFKCSLNDFVILATARAIGQYSEFRSQYNETEIVVLPSANIGIAVGTDNGLTVPVIIDADKMNLEQLASRTAQIVESARNGKLEGAGQGVFTITNLGMFGTEEFSAIINPPESGILAVGAIREGVKVENGAIRPTRLMDITLSADHRVVDGVVAAKFMQTLQQLLESPDKLL